MTGLAALTGMAAALLLELGFRHYRADTRSNLGTAPAGAVGPTPPVPRSKLGLLANDPRAFRGYTLLAPQHATDTYLIDMLGRVVRTWPSDCLPGLCARLLDNGHLLRPGQLATPPFHVAGRGGRVQEFTWDGDLVWDFEYAAPGRAPHHDVCKLPGGNVLMIVGERKSAAEAVAAGRRPEEAGGGNLLPDCVVEVKPTGPTSGTVVWEWHAWDHLIQDHDRGRANFGSVAEHPELIDVNFGSGPMDLGSIPHGNADQLRSIGYVGAGAPRVLPDWMHVNAVACHAELDQIVLTSREFGEVWVIDHGTTTAEATGHSGGRYGKGGDLLYRWGNPRAYRAGTARDQKLFGPHSGDWIPKGLPGGGHLLVFNNGLGRPDASFSTADEIVLPVGPDGCYQRRPGAAFGPDAPAWSYTAPGREEDFYAPVVSGAQRLPNGNTLVCGGPDGTVFEVTPGNETVWKYVNPIDGPAGPEGDFAPLGQILPPWLAERFHFTATQKGQLTDLQERMAARLTQLLTRQQVRRLRQDPGRPGPEAQPRPGQLLSPAVSERLQLTDRQQQELGGLQKEADDGLDRILSDDQRKQLRGMQQAFDRGRPPAPPPSAGKLPGGSGLPAGGPLFRAYRYGPDHPGLVGKDLTPGRPLEQLRPKEPPKK
jgi:hypothetical protein